MDNEMLKHFRVLELEPVKHLKGGDFIQIVRNKNSTNFIIEELFLNTKNGALRVAVIYECRNGIFVSKAIHIFLQIKLVSIIFFGVKVIFLVIVI